MLVNGVNPDSFTSLLVEAINDVGYDTNYSLFAK